MCRMAWIIAVLLSPLLAVATTGYGTRVHSPYFNILFQDFDCRDEQGRWHPTHWEELCHLTQVWQYSLRIQRVIESQERLRSALKAQPLGELLWEYEIPDDFKETLAARGIPARVVARQSGQVYTLQLAAYQQRGNLRRFLRRLPKGDPMVDGWSGPGIYRTTAKRWQLEYGSDDARYKDDPLYLQQHKGLARIRFGIYENVTDARRDAAVWEKRFQVKPIVVSVPLNRPLVEAVLWGDLPGVFSHESDD